MPLNESNRPISNADLQFILDRTANDFKSHIRDEKILVTGATGFFGKWLTQTFLGANDQFSAGNTLSIATRNRARALADSPWLNGRNDIEWIETDIRDLKVNTKFDTIIHGAAAASRDLNENRPDEMFTTLIAGTQRALEAAEASSAKRFMFVSSGAVYGTQPSDISHVSETYMGGPDPLDAKSAYSEGKRAAEFLSSTFARRVGFSLKIARCYAFVGPYLPLDTHFAAGNFVRNVLMHEPMRIGGDGTPLRSYLYAADLMVWLIGILTRGESHRAYNVGSDAAVSIKELAETIHSVGCELNPERRELSSPITIAKTPDPLRPREQYVPSVERARNELGLETWTPLPEAISRTLAWHQGQS